MWRQGDANGSPALSGDWVPKAGLAFNSVYFPTDAQVERLSNWIGG
jgi:hypothetical protein